MGSSSSNCRKKYLLLASSASERVARRNGVNGCSYLLSMLPPLISDISLYLSPRVFCSSTVEIISYAFQCCLCRASIVLCFLFCTTLFYSLCVLCVYVHSSCPFPVPHSHFRK